jgi:hypothetical protein
MERGYESMKMQFIHQPIVKKQWWGEGEWVHESDFMEFDHKGIKCIIRRACGMESNNTHCFGGHLCGYCVVPKNHANYGKRWDEFGDLEVHGGLTYFKMEDDNFVIGFDCAHSFDQVPSTKYLDETNEDIKRMRSIFPISPIWEKSYKNLEFVCNECKSMADQLILQCKDMKNE